MNNNYLSRKRHSLKPAGAAALLALGFAILQIAPGARFSETGRQVSSGIPLAVIFTALGILAVWVGEKRITLPRPTIWQSLFFTGSLVGLLGLSRADLPAAAPTVVQLGIYIFAAPYLIRQVVFKDGGKRKILLLFAVCPIILPILRLTGILNAIAPLLSNTQYNLFVAISAPFLIAYSSRDYRNWKGAVVAVHAILVGLTFDHGGILIAWLIGVIGTTVIVALPERRLLTVSLAGGFAALALSMTHLPTHGEEAPWEIMNPRYNQQHLKRFYIDGIASFLAPRHYPFGGGLGNYLGTINILKQYQTQLPHPEEFTVRRDGNSHLLVFLVEAGIPAAVTLVLLLSMGGLSGTKAGRRSRDDHYLLGVAAGMALFAALASGAFALILSRGTGLWIGALIGIADPGRRHQKPGIRLGLLAIPAVALVGIGGLAFLVNDNHPGNNHPSVANQWARVKVFGDNPQVWNELQTVSLPDLLAGVEGTAAHGAFQVEAEAAREFDQAFVRIPDNDASGGEALAIPVDGPDGEGAAFYDVANLPPGEYQVYARVFWHDGCSNSLRIRLADQSVVLTSDMYQRWHILTARRKIVVSEPLNEAVLENLENGIRIDYWGVREAGD